AGPDERLGRRAEDAQPREEEQGSDEVGDDQVAGGALRLSEASYRTMSAMLRITTVKANTFTTAARTPAMKNAVAVKAWASRRVTAPDGSGRFGWLTRSVSRS